MAMAHLIHGFLGVEKTTLAVGHAVSVTPGGRR
jgi:hypothetical protein